MDNLKFKYEQLGKWISNADTKAQILIGIQIFIIGFLLEKGFSDKHFCFAGLMPIVFVTVSCMGLYYLYKAIRSRLSNEICDSRIYFRDIAKNSEINSKEIKNLILTEKEEDFNSDITNQIVALARVCNQKYESLATAEKFMIVSFVIGIILYLHMIN